MLSKNLEDALNAQINAELWSAYLYLSMSAYFAREGKSGFENWFRVQALEEKDHAMKIFDYINTRNGKVKLKPIKDVPETWQSPLDVFEASLKHEKVVTALINDLVALAKEEKDYATENMLNWFVDEQIEEEATTSQHIDALKMIGDNGFGIYTMDKELKTRIYTPLKTNE